MPGVESRSAAARIESIPPSELPTSSTGSPELSCSVRAARSMVSSAVSSVKASSRRLP